MAYLVVSRKDPIIAPIVSLRMLNGNSPRRKRDNRKLAIDSLWQIRGKSQTMELYVTAQIHFACKLNLTGKSQKNMFYAASGRSNSTARKPYFFAAK